MQMTMPSLHIYPPFVDELPETMQNELLATVIVFLASNNREIVKSVLGFVKLCVITLPTSIVRPHLPQLVPGLLGWSHDHKNHFKVKVQHIFERMGRRFGWDSIMQHTGDENVEGRKVLENIKKRKERARKQKAKVAAARDEEDANALSEVRTTSPSGILLISYRLAVARFRSSGGHCAKSQYGQCLRRRTIRERFGRGRKSQLR